MPALRARNLAVSLDGYLCGPGQGPDHPLGVGGLGLHEWMFATPSFRRSHGRPAGETDVVPGDLVPGDLDPGDLDPGDLDPGDLDPVDDAFVAGGDEGIGATIIGRNMFGPVRGDWDATPAARAWTGWWGDDPPFHHPVFVLTHHPHDPITMHGGTTFHFVTDGIDVALEQAFEAAGGLDVRVGGGADTVRQYLRAGLLEEVHLAVVPVLLGAGERLFDDLAGAVEGLQVAEFTPSSRVVHVRLARNRV